MKSSICPNCGAQIKEQAYNPALAVLNLTKRYSEYDLEQACAYALTKTPVPRCKFIKSVLASKVAKTKQAPDILSKMMSKKELEPSRLDLERFFTPIQSPAITPYICDERMTF